LVKCHFCDRELVFPDYFKCEYCDQVFCWEHRLPPNHNCFGTLWWKERGPPKPVRGTGVEAIRIPKGSRIIESNIYPKKRRGISSRKVACLFGMLVICLIWVRCFQLSIQFLSPIHPLLFYVAFFLPLAVFHELMHALAWWYYGYRAIPIPILVPPILGITIGEKPNKQSQNFNISLAPILLSVSAFIFYYLTSDITYAVLGGVNLFGMMYDFISASG
jgi:hypothetical protein